MPNRILREGINSSERIARLQWPEEILLRRLMSVVDDYGRTDANPQLLRSRCYPLQTDNVRTADISRWLAACQKAGLLLHYEVSGKWFVEILDFRQQQRTPSKFPPPPSDEKSLPANASKCQQPPANEHSDVSVVGDGDEVDPPNPQRQAAGGEGEGSGMDRMLPKEEIWQRVCAAVGRDPTRPRSCQEETNLSGAGDIREGEMRLVERYAEVCRANPAKHTKPKALAHTLLAEFHAEVGKARAVFKSNGRAPKRRGALPEDWPRFVDWLAGEYSLSTADFTSWKAFTTWEQAERVLHSVQGDYAQWRRQNALPAKSATELTARPF